MYHNSYHIARAKCSYGIGGVDLKAIHSALAQAPDSAVAIISVALMLMGIIATALSGACASGQCGRYYIRRTYADGWVSRKQDNKTA